MKKILVVLTNVEKYRTTDRATGLWLGEATHFVEEVTKAGYSVDYVSPEGGYVPLDPAGMKTADAVDYKWYGDTDFKKRALSETMKPSDVNAEDYAAIYYTGGHGVMWDFKDNTELQQIAEKIYADGGYVTGVCHGVVALINLMDPATGRRLIAKKKVTGFSNMEERLNGTKKHMPYLTETAMKKVGAKYQSKRPMKAHAIVDGRIITGQNPPSAAKVGKKLVKAMSNQ